MALMNWCREKKLHIQREYIACFLLLMDPTLGAARTELKLPRNFAANQ